MKPFAINRTEEALIEALDRKSAPKPLRDQCEERARLEASFTAYGRKWGFAEAKSWAAKKAHWKPLQTTHAHAHAEALFSGGAE